MGEQGHQKSIFRVVKVVSTMKMLWSSWVTKSLENSLYFSGDSGYNFHHNTTGNRLGPFDVVSRDSGQYNELRRAVHKMPAEVIKGFNDLYGRYLVPVH